jgi:hypothetical protein
MRKFGQSRSYAAVPHGGTWRTATRQRPATGGRTPALGGETSRMLRPLLGISEPDLERELLRKGVGAREAGRRHCADCGRTPLVGERVHIYERGAVVCALCRPRRRAAPVRSQTVLHSEHGQTVRLRGRAAA